MNLKFWQKNDVDMKFVDASRKVYQMHPVMPARDVPTHFQKKQQDKYKKFPFVNCPGMIDLKNYGYIIPAWDDIHIMANKAGVSAVFGGNHGATYDGVIKRMSPDIADGIFQPVGIDLQVLHINNPWNIMVKNKSISAALMPAFFHSPFLDDLYVYPGIVDYNNFTTASFIFSPRRECKITIKAGTPLLQVLPFEVSTIKAGYGPADEYEKDLVSSTFSNAKHFYRKYVNVKKNTLLEASE
jgi:hypothetical protein